MKSETKENEKDVVENDPRSSELPEDQMGQSKSNVLTEVTFESLGICTQLLRACKKLGWIHPTQIQKETIPWALQKRDIIGLAQTGSGKTAAFSLPMLQALMESPQSFFGLILAPTRDIRGISRGNHKLSFDLVFLRELAFQISEQIDSLVSDLNITTITIVGGVDLMTQALCLAKKPQIVVGTPGRVLDHLKHTKGFSLSKLKYLVMDEADRLLNSEFEKTINSLLEVIPSERITFMFSATMTSKVNKLQRASLRNPVKIEFKSRYQTVETLLQNYLFIPEIYKPCYLTYLLIQFSGNSIIVFCDKCVTGQKITLMLRNLGFNAVPLNGKMDQNMRIGALNRFKEGEKSILVATDVASRGLHIPDVDLVINYDIPISPKDYVHRVGRTARIGRTGRAISLVSQYDVEQFQKIEEYIKLKMEPYQVDESSVLVLLERVSDSQRFVANELRSIKKKSRITHSKKEPPKKFKKK